MRRSRLRAGTVCSAGGCNGGGAHTGDTRAGGRTASQGTQSLLHSVTLGVPHVGSWNLRARHHRMDMEGRAQRGSDHQCLLQNILVQIGVLETLRVNHAASPCQPPGCVVTCRSHTRFSLTTLCPAPWGAPAPWLGCGCPARPPSQQPACAQH